MWWTISLTVTGIVGLWLVARHWYGWLLYLLNEVLWFVYAITIHAQPLMLMAVLWAAIGARNLHVARKTHLQSVRQVVPDDARPIQWEPGQFGVPRLQDQVRPD